MEKDEYYESEDADYDLEALFDALNDYAPEGFYFGASMGDGCDYGYWLSDEYIQEFDGLKVSDLGEVPKGYVGLVLTVTDHGNPSLFCFHRNHSYTVLWELV
jgi:hypothetical protein